jgi:hypothetical protein
VVRGRPGLGEHRMAPRHGLLAARHDVAPAFQYQPAISP